MKSAIPILRIITGSLLVILIINDFVPLLVEYLTGTGGVMLPIEFSPGGWKVKWWMIDHQPAFSLYQIFFMGTGMALLFSGLFRYLPSKLNLGIIAGLVLSGVLVILWVLLMEEPPYLIAQTPRPFMWAQIAAGLFLLPAALKKQNINKVARVATLIAAVLCALLLALCLIKSIVTLWFAIWPIIGVTILLLLQRTSKTVQ